MSDNLTPWLAGAAETGGRFAFNQFKGNGSTIRWGINFAGIAPGYLDRSHLKYYVTEDATGFSTGTYVVPANAFISGAILELKHPVTGKPIATGFTLSVFRDSPKQQPIPNFNDGSIVDEENLDTGFRQAVYAAAEMVDRFGVSSDKADQAFGIASQARDRADTAIATANSASAKAGTAINTANNASTKADSAISTANAASSTATTAKNTADTALSTADAAKTTADAASGTATNALNNSNVALTRSQEAKDSAAAAVTTADTARGNATTALNTASAASTKVGTAISTANTAKSTADTAKSTADTAKAAADGIDAKATQALSTANSANTKADTAVTTANDAKSTANAIGGKAQQALDTANAIDGKATTAINTANTANTKADHALAASDGTYNNYIRTYRNGDEAGIQYLDGSRTAPGHMLWAIVAASSDNNGDLYVNRVSNGTYAGAPIIINRNTGVVRATSGLEVDGRAASFLGPIDTGSSTGRGVTAGRDGNNVSVLWRRNEAATDEKKWDIIVDATDNMLKGRFVNDAYNAASDWLRVKRTALAVSNVWFGTRPQWNVSSSDSRLATAWDSINFDPNTKANLSGATFTGDVVAPFVYVANATNFASVHISANGYSPRIQTVASSQMMGFVNSANTEYNLQIFDDGRTQFRGQATFQAGALLNDRLVIARDGWQADLHMQNLSGRQNSNVYLRARIGGGLEIINSAHNDVPWQVTDDGATHQKGALHAGGAVFQTDGNINGGVWGGWLSEWLNARLGERARGGARVQWDSGIAEWGVMDIGVGIGAHTVDIPAPWVMMGMRKEESNTRCYLRGVVLRNQ